ncbi:putative deoxyribonuclease tatdn3-A [Aptenodytes patagonicus]|uniref:putative deoxyribonuclease tatdn3-A n=1 Tax=Aptenodytes patagonicus TaxID=9234 RepID=UPI003FA02E5F
MNEAGVRSSVPVTEQENAFERVTGLAERTWNLSSRSSRNTQISWWPLARHVFALSRNVHPCSAGRQTIAFLKEEGVQDVLLHNFAGRQSVTLEGVQAGYYFSFPPAVTRHDQLIKQIPLQNVCLKTDPPSLAPNKEVFSNLHDSMILYICKSPRDLTRWRNNLCAAKDNCSKESLENAWSAFPTQEFQQGQSLLVSG